jgi:hypothetical protein
VGGGALPSIISLSAKARGNEKNVFERDGISKDKTNINPLLFGVN